MDIDKEETVMSDSSHPETFWVQVGINIPFAKYIAEIEAAKGQVIRLNPCPPHIKRTEIEVVGDFAAISIAMMHKFFAEEEPLTCSRVSLAEPQAA